jgi:RNA-directed DNA polymerase
VGANPTRPSANKGKAAASGEGSDGCTQKFRRGNDNSMHIRGRLLQHGTGRRGGRRRPTGLPRLRGKATFVRYADDGVFGFECQDDAERVMAVLGKRMERFGLTLHPQKTRLLDFSRPLRSREKSRGLSTFDFLGFCWYWRRTRKGNWAAACRTRRARMARAIQRVNGWCRENRHLAVRQQHARLVRRVQGHINYFGVNGNTHSLRRFVYQVKRSRYKWLNRRSQRARLSWERFNDLLSDMPLPKARVVVSIWT